MQTHPKKNPIQKHPYLLSLFLIVLFVTAIFSDNYSDWQYSVNIQINTTLSGITGPVANFPLLVRLTNANFNFSLAKTDGSDIRFSLPNGSHLFYEKERWDYVNKIAEYWVLVDTIFNNTSNQFITLYYGKSDASDSSNSEEVFKTSHHFQGIWHLNESFTDATVNNNNGFAYGSTDGNSVVGKGRYFDGNDYIEVPYSSTLNTTVFTTSCWATVHGNAGYYRAIFSTRGGPCKGYNLYAQNIENFSGWIGNGPSWYGVATSNFAYYTWYYLTLTYNGSTFSIYLDGNLINATNVAMVPNISYPFRIGTLNDGIPGGYHVGYIDEVRVSSTNRSSDWIKLTYESQKISQTITTMPRLDSTAIITQPLSDTVPLNQSFSCIVSASGYPVPTYQWMKDGVLLVNQTNATLTIISVSAQNEGLYQAIVSNTVNSDTSDAASLYAYDPIFTIIDQPQSDTALAGHIIQFSVNAQGHNLLYQWQQKSPNWLDIPGQTLDSLVVTVDTTLDGRNYRCVITSGPVNKISDSAFIYVSTVPVLSSNLLPEMVITAGDSISFSASAIAKPAPEYYWYVKSTPTSDSILLHTGSMLSFTTTPKQNEGYYYFIADNGFGRIKSNTLSLYVGEPVTITLDLPSTYLALNSGTALLHPGISGDGTMSFQWYENGNPLPADTSATYTISPIDSLTQHRHTYFCEISNHYQNTLINTVQTRVCTLVVTNYFNPFKLKVEPLSFDTHDKVIMKVWSDINISNFPTKDPIFPPSQWADSMWVFYKSNGFVQEVTQASTITFSTERVKTSTDTLFDTVTVGPLPPNNDSCFWFNYTVLWHNPNPSSDTLLRPFMEANKVFLADTLAPENPLALQGTYVSNTDSARLRLKGIQSLTSKRDSIVVIQCSYYPQFSALLFDTSLAANTLLTNGDSTASLGLSNLGTLPLELDTIYCQWFVVGKNSVKGEVKDTFFTIGLPRPMYSGVLSADSTQRGNSLHLQWQSIPAGTEKIRVWWDTKPITLTHTFTLAEDQAFYINPLNKLIDTLRGLSNNTQYYLGLQIQKDSLWSVVTEKSSTSMKTAMGDTSQIPNILSIDSSWFQKSTNSIMLVWHLDLNDIAINKTAEIGYTHGLEGSLDSAIKPIKWHAIQSDTNTTAIPLYPSITFDTVQTVGLWLRGIDNILGPGQATQPTDSSTAKIRIPSFTWQELTFFPNVTDTVYAANKKIILTQDYHFTTTDTVWSYQLDSIPTGFVQVGGAYFNFGNKNLQVPPFLLGLTYDSLPSGITESDLGLYQFKNGQIHSLHGAIFSNGALWDTVTLNQLAFPFLILADTLSPVIALTSFNDTVSPGMTVITHFRISDNNANTFWQFLYGSGHTGYTYKDEGYLESTRDTTLERGIIDKNFLINPSTGLRAIIIANDGISADTANVSRFVRTTKSGSIAIKGQEWIPLSVPAHLDNPDLQEKFEKSQNNGQPWEYDNTRYRLFRWLSDNTSQSNQWIEYAQATKHHFTFMPGRIIWCKTAETQVISFDKGTTISLRKPFEISLKPHDWTDLTLPFQFPIMLRDVLDATGIEHSKKLEVYHWEKIGKTFGPMVQFIGGLDSITTVQDTLNPQQIHNGYLIYNHSDTDITLKIPPTSLALSMYANQGKRNEIANPDVWTINLFWKNATENNNSYRRLRCGYKNNTDNSYNYGFLPPSMNLMKVGFVNKNNSLCSWILESSLANNGMHFECVFENNSDKEQRFEYYLDNLEVLPQSYNAKILNPATNTFELWTKNNTGTIFCQPQSSSRRLVAIGTNQYFDAMLSAFLPIKLIKTYPNPFNSAISISYRIPLGIKEVHFELYNLRGQLLWNGINRDNLTPGYHIYRFNEHRDRKNQGLLSSGVYILQLKAIQKSGGILYGGKHRLTRLR